MKVQVVYGTPRRQLVLPVELPDGATVQDAITRSGLLERAPEVDLGVAKVGIWSKIVPLETVLEPDARVEVYRPITADPATVKRRKKPDDE
jgi:putative ubiquitin-RnfH superfamily antitoxin RatB of RatAB toxin-antitoxin module